MPSTISMKNKQELLDLIISGGLLEDFVEWARRKGIQIDFAVKPGDLDEKIILEYAKEKSLVADDSTLGEELGDNIESLEPLEVRPRTPPRR